MYCFVINHTFQIITHRLRTKRELYKLIDGVKCFNTVHSKQNNKKLEIAFSILE